MNERKDETARSTEDIKREGKTESRDGTLGMTGGGNGGTNTDTVPLMNPSTAESHRGRWKDIQANFVDQPQESVRAADGLVAEIIQALTSSFADQRKELEGKWSSGSEVSTEDLRRALQQYRSFFERLLAA